MDVLEKNLSAMIANKGSEKFKKTLSSIPLAQQVSGMFKSAASSSSLGRSFLETRQQNILSRIKSHDTQKIQQLIPKSISSHFSSHNLHMTAVFSFIVMDLRSSPKVLLLTPF